MAGLAAVRARDGTFITHFSSKSRDSRVSGTSSTVTVIIHPIGYKVQNKIVNRMSRGIKPL